MKIPWESLSIHDPMQKGDRLWSLDELTNCGCDVHVLDAHSSYLAITPNIPDEGRWIEFVVCTFVLSDVGGANTYVEPWWRGSGPGGRYCALRELRHSWFGNSDDKGYVHYLNGTHMRKALSFLEQYFDMDG